MSRPRRPILSALLALVPLLSAGVPVVLAADPPGVLRDVTVTVVFRDPIGGTPWVGAEVEIRAGGAIDETWTGTTDATGTAVIAGVARQAADGPAVTLEVEATSQWSDPVCFGTQTTGQRAGIDSREAVLEVVFDETEIRTLVADANVVLHDQVVTVVFVDAITLLPVDAATVTVTASGAAEGTFGSTTDADGRAVLTGLPRQRCFGPEVFLEVVASKDTTFSDPETGCTGGESWDAARAGLEAWGAPIEVAYTIDEQVVTSSIQCPSSQPSGGVGGVVGTPGVTPPNTATAGVSAGAAPGAGLATAAAVALVALALIGLARRRTSPSL